VAVEKLVSRKTLERTLHWEALQTTISIFWTLSIPEFPAVLTELEFFNSHA
jgi:hypothetical protein